ncbi:MAG: chemotaxis protein CheB [Lysobacter sp.]
MTSDPPKVALLARPGVACDRLRDVLQQAGAHCVLQADPTELALSQLVDAAPEVVLVALDPQTEDALDRFDEVLSDVNIEVMYEEASLTAAREGWEVARWQRHLVAKLQHHGDVLPPGTEPEDTSAIEYVSSGAHPFDPVAAEEDVYVPAALADESGLDAGMTLVVEDVVESAESVVDHPDPQPGEGRAKAGQDTQAVAPAIELGGGSLGVLTLDDGSAPLTALDDDDAKNSFQRDLSELEARISSLSLVDDLPTKAPGRAHGLVLVLAGLGGPDAVRQLLGAIPEGFPRPVLVQQRLDGGHYDKLVAQMQRATSLPVRLAEAGQFAHAGIIYILPAEIGADIGDTEVRFNQGGELLATLPSSDSAVLLLSGADPTLVDAALRHGLAGALIAGQAADGCYDAAAPNELAARGGDTGTPAELAQRLAKRWPA